MLTLFIVVTIIHYLVVLHVKMAFDLECQQVFWHCEQNDGLVESERETLLETLEDKGFEDVIIEAPASGSISKGEKVLFSVRARKPLQRCIDLLKTENFRQDFVYEQFIVGRRVIN